MSYKDYAYQGYSGTYIKQKYVIVLEGKKSTVLVGLNKGVARLRYPATYSGVQYLHTATPDLKCLLALMICDLVPIGIAADKLQDEFPEHENACRILRDWQAIRDKLRA